METIMEQQQEKGSTIIQVNKSKRIILYNPIPKIGEKQIDISLALLSISAKLHEEGFDIHIINHSYKDVTDQILKLSDDCLCMGMGMMTGNQIKDGLAICKNVKERNPGVPVIWGGWHPSILPQQTLENPYIDIVVKGQAQRTFHELVHALYGGKPIDNILGISYKNKDGKIVHNGPRPIEPLDNFPRMPYELIPEDKLIRSASEMSNKIVDYFSSQGCPYRCEFCADPDVYKRRTTLASAERVLDDIQFLVERYKIDCITCTDTNFFINEKRIQDICKGLIERNIRIRWGSLNIRSDQFLRLKEDTLELMEKVSFHSFLNGAESGDQEILDLIKKDSTVENTVNMAKRCKKYGFKTYFSFMIGLPLIPENGETSEMIIDREFKALVNILDKILAIEKGHMFYVSIYTPYPGSPLYQNALRLGFKEPKNLEEWGEFTFDKIQVPWIPKKYVVLADQLEELFLPFLTGHVYKKFDNYGTLGKIAKPGAKAIGRLVGYRWKKRNFDFPIEYHILKKGKALMRTLYPRRGYRD
ncbi:radical SAM protein [Candidatus Woesearchaeota archaeon]|nr:radical SAM protein [Candidatus Woesearchaeota archaeon]